MSAVHRQLFWQDVAVVAPARVQMEPASPGARLGAFLIDYMLCLLGGIIVIGVGSLVNPYLTLLAVSQSALGGIGLVFILDYLFVGGITGQTIGKKLLAIQVVTADGEPVGWGRMAGRCTLGYIISLGLLGFGFLWALWDSESRTWHDKMFSTYVVKVKNDET